VLAPRPTSKSLYEEFEEYVKLKVEIEKRTEKFPFAKDDLILNLLNKKL
jgi:hypothetical protein